MDKRERGRNYTEQEKQQLIEIIASHKKIVENKETDAVNVTMKKNAWELITSRYNAVAITGSRNANQLKLLYENIKRKSKKMKSDEKIELYKTGGGVSKVKMGQVEETYFNIIDDENFEILNEYDSTAPLDKLLNKEMLVQEPSTSFSQATENIEEIADTSISFANKDTETSQPQQTPRNKLKLDLKKKSDNKETIKLDILKIRKECEEIKRDILIIEKKEKKLKYMENYLKFKEKYPGVDLSD